MRLPNTPRLAALALPLAAAALAAAGACGDYLTGGDLSVDPNRPTRVTATQLFVGAQTNPWALLGSDMPRVTAVWTQQFQGGNIQYVAIYNYGVDETTMGQFYANLYGGGGFADLRDLQARVRATRRSSASPRCRRRCSWGPAPTCSATSCTRRR